VLWAEDSFHATPNHIRVRLSCRTPAILVDRKTNVIVAANGAWQDQCGYRAEAIGATPKILAGERTDAAKAARFTQRVYGREGRAGTTLVNYRSDGTPFLHTITASRIGDFFLAKSTRSIDLQTASAPHLGAIGVALLAACVLIHLFSAVSSVGDSATSTGTASPPLPADRIPVHGVASAFVAAALAHQPFFQPKAADPPAQIDSSSALVAEGAPVVGICLLALLVAAMWEEESAAAKVNDEDDDDEIDVAGSHFLGPVPLVEVVFTAAICLFLVAQGPQ